MWGCGGGGGGGRREGGVKEGGRGALALRRAKCFISLLKPIFLYLNILGETGWGVGGGGGLRNWAFAIRRVMLFSLSQQ